MGKIVVKLVTVLMELLVVLLMECVHVLKATQGPDVKLVSALLFILLKNNITVVHSYMH